MVDSTCESEYIVASASSKEAIWLKNFIGNHGVVLAKELRDHGRSIGIDKKYHFIRHRVEEGLLVVKRVSLEENPTDPSQRV